MIRTHTRRVSLLAILLLAFLSTGRAQDESRLEIKEIEFVGQETYSAADLASLIASEERPMWLWRFLDSWTPLGAPTTYFDRSKVPVDIQAIRGFYQERGFFFTEVEFELVEEEDGVIMRYHVAEGPAFTFGEFETRGVEGYRRQDQIEEIAQVDTSARYSQARVREIADELVYLFKRNGYWRSGVDSLLVVRDSTEKTANVRATFRLGDRYRLTRVNVNTSGPGAYGVRDDLLERLAGVDTTKDYYNIENIRQAQVRLYRTGLFSSVTLTPRVVAEKELALEVNGRIDELNEMGPELLLNNQWNAFNVGLALNYSRMNFLGDARKLDLRASFGLQDVFNTDYGALPALVELEDSTIQGYVGWEARLEQPYLFGEPIFGRVDLYQQVKKGQGELRIDESLLGGKLTLDFELPAFTFFNFLNTYYKVDYIVSYDRVANERSYSFLGGLGFDVKSAKANDLVFPTGGYTLGLILEEGNFAPWLGYKIAGKDFDYPIFYKAQVTGATYLPLDLQEETVLATKLRVGYLDLISGAFGQVALPYRFFAGGSNSLRGWRARQLGPDVGAADDRFLVEGKSGGAFLVESALEYRRRLDESFGYVVFVDAGNAYLDPGAFALEGTALDAGVGGRFFSDFISFRVDFGFKLYDPDDPRSILRKPFFDVFEFHFGVGEAF
jgi:outer membrane protein insertion porin family